MDEEPPQEAGPDRQAEAQSSSRLMASNVGLRPQIGSLGLGPAGRGLSRGLSPEMSSRFSEFSSVAGTPETQSLPNFAGNKSAVPSSEGSFLRESSSNFLLGDPAAGLGIGASGPSTPMRDPSSRSMQISISTSNVSLSVLDQTPVASPRVLDRAGQIGIGELATPRLVLPSSGQMHRKQAKPVSVNGVGHIPESFSAPLLVDDHRRPSDMSTFAAQQEQALRSPPATSALPATKSELGSGREPDSESSRHGRSISYSVGAPGSRETTKGSGSALPSSKSVNPAADYNSLSSLAQSFDPEPAELLAQFESFTSRKRERDSLVMQSKSTSSILPPSISPSFSIGAMSDTSEDAAALSKEAAARADLRSVLGDSAWSADEMGPFGMSESPPVQRSQVPPALTTRAEKADPKGESARRVLADLDGAISESDRGSFDLGTAITDLLHEHDRKKVARQAAGGLVDEEDSSSDAGPSLPQSLLYLRARHAQHQAAKQRESTSTVTSVSSSRRASAKTATRQTPSESQRNSTETVQPQSPISVKTSARNAALPTPPVSAAGSGSRRRTSTSSIAQSLLRGSMPPEAADQYQTLVSTGRKSRGSGEITEDAASEALRKLDGIRPTTPRSSRDAQRTSRQYGSRTPNNSSRTNSPARQHTREGTRPESLRPAPRAQRADGHRNSAQASPKSTKTTLPDIPRAAPESSAPNSRRGSTMASIKISTGDEQHLRANGHSPAAVTTKAVPPVPPLPRALDKTSPILPSSASMAMYSPSSASASMFAAPDSAADKMEHMTDEADMSNGSFMKPSPQVDVSPTTKEGTSSRRGSFSLPRKFSFSSLSNALVRSPSSREKQKVSPVQKPADKEPKPARRLSALPIKATDIDMNAFDGMPMSAPLHGASLSPRIPSTLASPQIGRNTSRASMSSHGHDKADNDKASITSGRTSRSMSILGIAAMLRTNSRRTSFVGDGGDAPTEAKGGLLSKVGLSMNSGGNRKRTTVSAQGHVESD